MYKFIRQLLFLFPTEGVHHFSMNALKLACKVGFIKRLISQKNTPGNQQLRHELFGLHFKNPVGLAAGFDKNALYLNELEALGFGYVEIGTVTPKPQAGNDQPRLFRLPKDQALINRMGFNNDGVKMVAKRLKEWREKQKNEAKDSPLTPDRYRDHSSLIIGGNIGKNKVTPNEDAWKDYEICFRELFDCVDYFVVNVSSPNTPGLRELQEKDALRKILSHLQTINQTLASATQEPKPLLLKIAPDLTREQIDDVIDLALEIKLDGLVATNTTIDRSGLQTPDAELSTIGAGGLSGKPLTQRSTEIVQYIAQKTQGTIPVIASGGIFTGADAREKLQAGASLIQVWTGFIYEGPGIVQNICQELA
ncbi:quinone-dependent dihydroorotate dehydrogenase [Pseudoflavitalea sp. X16]|uniref:quinone-dependent dihydroorotate dehydrogenase n=1 Tax=Paraflavitalea devenefica TaxID=2716334 RepID=UPI00141F24B0|nr:quinone-dependent dihydroorotate dehydrogenase [Paraflavitalea devenefica]NII23713.1 quinone-dependent dihydroorotate dehydrogenase [Paraflavitalea devenefica]